MPPKKYGKYDLYLTVTLDTPISMVGGSVKAAAKLEVGDHFVHEGSNYCVRTLGSFWYYSSEPEYFGTIPIRQELTPFREGPPEDLPDLNPIASGRTTQEQLRAAEDERCLAILDNIAIEGGAVEYLEIDATLIGSTHWERLCQGTPE